MEPDGLELQDLIYAAGGAEEHFLSFATEDDRLAGFLRLSLPGPESVPVGLIDLEGAALIREVHVYGQSLEFGADEAGAAQHVGLGMRLMQEAEARANRRGYRRMAVISALGTRGYYRRLGYRLGETYMLKDLWGPGRAGRSQASWPLNPRRSRNSLPGSGAGRPIPWPWRPS